MHDEFLNQRYGTFFFIAILDGIFICSYGTYINYYCRLFCMTGACRCQFDKGRYRRFGLCYLN
jgi:hypothetical protein